MSDNDDWVSEVRRWCLARQRAGARTAPTASDLLPNDDDPSRALGYEAAHPLLQSRHWPDSPPSGFGALG